MEALRRISLPEYEEIIGIESHSSCPGMDLRRDRFRESLGQKEQSTHASQGFTAAGFKTKHQSQFLDCFIEPALSFKPFRAFEMFIHDRSAGT
jgi:hypothetical protein